MIALITEAFAHIGGLAGMAALVTALATLRKASFTAAQFQNNGGSSTKDALDRIENVLAAVQKDVAENKAYIALARDEHKRLWRAISRKRRR